MSKKPKSTLDLQIEDDLRFQTIKRLAGRSIPLMAGTYSAEALLTMALSSRDPISSGVAVEISGKLDELQQWMEDLTKNRRDTCVALIDDIRELIGKPAEENGETKPEPEIESQVHDYGPYTDDTPPEGKPGLLIMYQSLDWLRGGKERLKKTMGSLETGKINEKSGKPQLRKSPKEFISTTLQIGVAMEVNWALNRMHDDKALKVSDLHAAMGGNLEPLRGAMEEWGLLLPTGMKKGSDAAKAAKEDPEIRKQVNGRSKTEAHVEETRKTNGAPKAKNWSTARVCHIFHQLFNSTKDPSKVADHLEKNLKDPGKALNPFAKGIEKKTDATAEEVRKVIDLFVTKEVAVEDLVPVFQATGETMSSSWRALYERLGQVMDTQGPRPPWLAELS